MKVFIVNLDDKDQKIELEALLSEQMEIINAKNKSFKHNLNHLSHGSSGNYSQGSGGGSGGGYSGHGK